MSEIGDLEIQNTTSPSVSNGPDSSLSASAVLVTRDSVIAMVGGLVSQGFKFAALIYVARRFSTTEFGMIVFALAVNACIFVVSNFGLPVFGTREVAKSGFVSSGLLRRIIFIRAVLSVLAILGSVAILGILPSFSVQELTLVVGFGLSNFALAGFVDWAFQGIGRQDASAILNTIWQATWFVFIILGVHLGLGLVIVPLGNLVGALLASIIGYWWLKGAGYIVLDVAVTSTIRDSVDTLRAGAHLGIGTLLNTVLVWTDAIAVRLFWGARAAGLYAAGSRPANALILLCGYFMLGAFPLLSRASSNRERFQFCFQQTYNDLALIYVPFALWGSFYAREILLLVFKRPEYLMTVPVFEIFQFAVIVVALNNLYGTGILLSCNQDRSYRRVFRDTTIVFLILCFTLTRLLGMIGTALSVTIAQLFSLILFMGRSRNFAQPRHAEALFLPLSCTVAAVLICRVFTLHLWAATLILALTYLFLFGFREKAARAQNRLTLA